MKLIANNVDLNFVAVKILLLLFHVTGGGQTTSGGREDI